MSTQSIHDATYAALAWKGFTSDVIAHGRGLEGLPPMTVMSECQDNTASLHF